jgi:endonuclease/exonuclease/phosphatase family metal-dependent hydrolase
MLVRSWNLFHGNTDPPARRGYLREMIELASADRPDVLCLQELPVWALPRLRDWSGLRPFVAVARRPLLPGSVPGWITRIHQGRLRSTLTGQANAILVASPPHVVEDLGHERISDHGRERRLAQGVRIDDHVVVVNLHASQTAGRPKRVQEEVERARSFAESRAASDETIVLAGDFNVTDVVLPAYSPSGPGIDHVLVKGAPSVLSVWPRHRRLHEGLVLSDHAPVEAAIG